MNTTDHSHIHVTRPWLVAFAATAAAAPLGIFAIGAAVISATLSLREWIVVAIFIVSTILFTWLCVSRSRFCTAGSRAQRIAATILVGAVVTGYALLAFNLQRAA